MILGDLGPKIGHLRSKSSERDRIILYINYCSMLYMVWFSASVPISDFCPKHKVVRRVVRLEGRVGPVQGALHVA